MKKARFLLPLVLLAVIGSFGCGRGSMVPYQSRVSYRGYNLTSGLVVFIPEQRGPLSVGRIRDDGSFVLYTGESPGIYPGSYRITVCALNPGTPDGYGRFDFPQSALPEKYRDPELSGLSQVIEPGRIYTGPIDLTEVD
ncbi:MAG TPA: hypothetical protein VHR72_01010 [Gemmataceae bacterium]|nr:hypothetical protein [Gemmataceae bacterium]